MQAEAKALGMVQQSKTWNNATELKDTVLHQLRIRDKNPVPFPLLCDQSGIVTERLLAQELAELERVLAKKSLPASSRLNQLQLQRDLSVLEISGGHALEKHVVSKGEFPGWIRTRAQFHEHLKSVVEDPETLYRKAICPKHKKFQCGKNIYYQRKSNTLIAHNQHSRDGGTAFQPIEGEKKFYEIE